MKHTKSNAPEESGDALKLTLDECGGAPEALEVILKDVSPNIMRNNDTLRSAETNKKRVASLNRPQKYTAPKKNQELCQR